MTTAHTTVSPAAVLARFHEAEGQFFGSEGASMPSFEGILHPDFVLVEPGDGPYGGAWHGRRGLERFLRAMVADWAEQGPRGTPEVLENENTAVALATVAATCRGTGRVVVFPMAQVARVRDGLLTETRVHYWDPREMNEALAEARALRPATGTTSPPSSTPR